MRSSAPVLLGSTTPRLWTPPLVTGPPGPCGCGCALTPSTSAGFSAVEFGEDVIGMRLIPWQRWLLVHAHELRWDGRFRFRTVLVLVARQNGKALDASTPILTANRGWITMREIAVGDLVFHPDGRPTRVTFVSDIQEGHDCYRVTTTDGRSLIADAEHLWTVTDKRRTRSVGPRGNVRRWFEQRTLTTRDMLDEGVSRYANGGRTSSTGGKQYATNEYRFVLPDQKPLVSDDVDLPLDPYLFGAWLGDGTSASAALTSHVDDVPHWVAEITRAGFIPTVRPGGGTADTRVVGITCMQGPKRQSRSFAGALARLGVLRNKHIPDCYLAAGTSQREALLQGLLDTDGSIESRRGQVEFCSMNRALAEGVLFLARSLGWRATLREGRAVMAGRDYGTKHRVFFTPVRIDPYTPFRLPRKVARIKEADGGKGRATLSVAGIEAVPSVPVRCIKVEAPDGLFLAGRDLVPTHNTSIVEVKNLWKMFVLGVGLVIGTAQNLDISEESWDKAVEIVEGTPELAAEVEHVDRTNGKKALRLASGSRWKIAAASRKGGRGLSGDDVNLDELREHQTWDAWGAVTKTTMARANPQIWAFSNAGDDKSVVLNQLQEQGRATAADPSVDPAFGYFEWSAPDEVKCTCGRPDNKHTADCRLQDREAWAQANPSLGYTIAEDAIASALSTDPEPIFRTEVLCQHVPDLRPEWVVIPEAKWRALADEQSELIGRPSFAIHVAMDRSWAAVAVVGAREDGLLHVEIVDYRMGTQWVPDRAKQLDERWNPCAWVVDAGGPAGSLIADLEAKGLDITKPSARDVAAAYGQFVDAVMPEEGEPTLRYMPHPALDVAVAGAATRSLTTAKAWDAVGATTESSPLIAATNAAWGFATKGHIEEEPAVPPFAVWA